MQKTCLLYTSALNTTQLKKYPKVIVTSAVGQDSMIQKAMEMGAQYYLVKPINLGLLIKRIKDVYKRQT